MGEAVLKPFYTVEEYLELQRELPYKIEYHNGEVFAMAGGSVRHALLANTIGALLREKLKGRNCNTFNSDLMIGFEEYHYVYADASVICGKPETWEANKNAVRNVCLVVEVLSSETEEYDRGTKFDKYQQMETFVEYVLVSQNRPWVEVFFKPQDIAFWQYKAYYTLEDIIVLRSLDIEISMKDLYEGVF